jgi:hypothetical protein
VASSTALSTASFPNNTTPHCRLCFSNQAESIIHLFIECKTSIEIWHLATAGHEPHPTLQQLICPSPLSKPHHPLITRHIHFTHLIWKLSQSRRFSTTTPLLPLDQEALSKLARRLQQHHTL